ncbi:acyl-CoA N-acyltransferase [Dacryopinax primogenitus]|uniref:Acyl-CoA N-acyltransferase n=1 Tax=Dacryopinax primogenitus (strain DJM 731) TaxID=1858805 RepID=M5FU99_DACPD|nr:acyl-CoA N-acyltransferase [Dacryopinax primogenitus]EJU01286.1 acyl-CoA N-acyltransferase [Dacryopinax primogenitus]
MIPFATTEHLILRPWRPSDAASFFSLYNDQRVAHGIVLGYPVPWPEARWESILAALNRMLLLLVLEIKPEFMYMRRSDPEEIEDERDSEGEKREKRKIVGFVSLVLPEPKNRDTEFSIALAFAWWSLGLGTEVLTWLMRYNFDKLGMHRLTLHAFGDNERAVELYKHLGFVLEGTMREAVLHDNEWIDLVVMGILDREWEAVRRRPLDLAAFDDVIVQSVMRLI